jgi:hypothetical protein
MPKSQFGQSVLDLSGANIGIDPTIPVDGINKE